MDEIEIQKLDETLKVIDSLTKKYRVPYDVVIRVIELNRKGILQKKRRLFRDRYPCELEDGAPTPA